MLFDSVLPNALYHPESNAIWYKNLSLTYENLNAMLLQADRMIDYENCPQVIILLMDRSIELVLATISVYVSAHIFCIIDVNTPIAHLVEIIRELGTNMIFTDKIHDSKWKDLSEECKLNIVTFSMDHAWKELSISKHICFDHREMKIQNSDCSHIVYTSGSTNIPKGIISSRKALLKFIEWEKEYLSIDAAINVAQMSTPWFDPFMRDIFLPLCCGGCICIPTKREFFDPKAFFEFAEEKRIDIIHIVPTLFRQLFLSDRYKQPHKIKKILLAGEMVYGADIKKYFKFYNYGDLYNLYGPSETTMAKFCYKITERDGSCNRIKVGKPLPETYCKIIDEEGKELPTEQEGEVVIYTKQCSYGYLKRQELNQQRFTVLNDGITSFKTSDTGILHSDGNLEIIGRLDTMQKIYGQKVYPEEIESVIRQCNGIHKCIAYIKGTQIIGVIEINHSFIREELEDIIQTNLVGYKRPHIIYIVEQIPTNKNGKLDRRNIKSMEGISVIEKIMI